MQTGYDQLIVAVKVGLMHDSETSRDVELSSKNLNGTHNSKKLKNPALPGSVKFFPLCTGAAGFLNMSELRVPLRFFEDSLTSHDVSELCMSPNLV